MTDSLRLAGFVLTAALAAFVLRPIHQQAGSAVALAAGAMLLFSALEYLAPVVTALQSLSEKAGLESGTVQALLRLIALAYLTEFAAQACQDAGESGLAAKAGFCGKMLLLAQTLPLITQIGEMTLALAP